MLKLCFFHFIVLWIIYARPVVINGGQVTINGVITSTQIDIMVNYTANVKWLAIIWSKDEVNADVHLVQTDTTNTAKPVSVKDCYLNENSYIVNDDVGNIQPSVTNFSGSINNGIQIAYNRDLATGDNQDIRFYPNQIIQICFISSTQQFIGNGYQTGHEKICSFFSLHEKVLYYEDRLLGNFASTSLFYGLNLTIYASQSTDQATVQSWLFLTVIIKQQGLNTFDGKWIGITFLDSLTKTDMVLIEQSTFNFIKSIHIHDMYIDNSTFAQKDEQYTTLQGGKDVFKNLGAIDPTKYIIGAFKRKFTTGDTNRDITLSNGQQTYCFILGNSLQFTTFSFKDRTCLTFTLTTPYFSNFRVSTSTQQTVITIKQQSNVVRVIKYQNQLVVIIAYLGTILVIFVIS